MNHELEKLTLTQERLAVWGADERLDTDFRDCKYAKAELKFVEKLSGDWISLA